MSDLIRRDDVVKAMNEALAVGDISRAIANDILNNIPSADPERIIKIGQRSGKTLESAINYLQSTGWLQEHDRILTQSAEPERKKGKWIDTGWKIIYKCSECGNYLDLSGVNAGRGDANFCPNCGAEMARGGR